MKTKFKGTQGLWKSYTFDGKGGVIDIIQDNGQNENLLPQIAQVLSLEQVDFKEPMPAELKANAKLIASAPELLQTVIELHTLLEEHLPNWYLKYHDNIVKKVLEKSLT